MVYIMKRLKYLTVEESLEIAGIIGAYAAMCDTNSKECETSDLKDIAKRWSDDKKKAEGLLNVLIERDYVWLPNTSVDNL